MAQPVFDPALVEASLLRPLTDAEALYADTLAGKVWRRIVAREASFEDDPPALTADVIAEVVARIVRNPGRYLAETDGDYSYSRKVADSELEPTSSEWALLTGRTGAFSIDLLATTAGADLPWWDGVQVAADT